jgi:thiosulfate dehydrogenase [quinone] large subunit
VAALAAALLALFAVEMTIALGIKAPLDYSVFAASAAAAMLLVCTQQRSRVGLA